MMKIKTAILVFLLVAGISCTNTTTKNKDVYEPTFKSLKKADPVPEWFKDAKFGIYFHWGVYTVPAYANEWYPRNMYIEGSNENKHHIEVYGNPADWPYNNFITGAKNKAGNFVQFAPKLKSEGGNFDPDEWAQLFADAGAKFAGPVAEHHDGFSMWASKVNPWNAKDMGPQLDLVGLLTNAIREKNMKVILSMHHAYNITGFYNAVPPTNDPKLQILYGQQGKEKNEALWLDKHKEIIDYYKPDIIWQDFNLHVISQPILLKFLSYYYNKASEWNKEVVATYKDGLNKKCAVLDYERGGPVDITENYWLTDDAISSSSWCYTEGIGYYSEKQVLHGFLDRISKNGNLLLNISPKADGSIPQEQKDVLLAMGDWLKKYGEAVYATRAWEIYGEGPTKMGAAHGVFMEPSAGMSKDIRFTRSKDNKTLYAILLGWDKGQKEVILNTLGADRIDCSNLKSVQLINGDANNYYSLEWNQNAEGLTIQLPERSFEELAYVLKLNFDENIPEYDNYADLNCNPFYHLSTGENNGMVLGENLNLTDAKKEFKNQWKLGNAGKGFYKIRNRANETKVIACDASDQSLILTDISDAENQLWKIDETYGGRYKIHNKQFPEILLIVKNNEDVNAPAINAKWELTEVCELKQEAFKPHEIPGIIEAEDYDIGCPGEVYADKDDRNEGGKYRPDEGVDIDTCLAGGYTVGWVNRNEWLAYTVNVNESANYKVSFYIASTIDDAKIHLYCDGNDITGTIALTNSKGYQNWTTVEKTVKLDAGKHILKLVLESSGFNIDKMNFEMTN